ncbi:PLDc N-terminal domain-containing protein [Lutibacter sp. A64]|uniref:PLDc N-terminal domain-containing protein n=1 Tax=Lutibacter sp. A64 TaxID=2918526 RepID=UPI001F05F0B7|nr:PLDc N-terminal domain-containing protein [Lutibacter sp. A64]UMB53813.1 PLDc N-terminal domain-containing protein [Lutibacter sp. A64]
MEIIIDNFSFGLFFWQIIIIISIILPIIALIDILKNDFKGNEKLIWVLIVLFLSLIGVLLYYKFGIKQKIQRKNTSL